MQPDKFYRWDYDYVERGEPQQEDFVSMFDGFSDFQLQDDDRWTVGSSSASTYSSTGHRSPSTSSGGGSRSPTDEGHAMWEGDTLASGSDSEHGR
jgi:inositol phosphorylceramide synthase catalytic subunit